MADEIQPALTPEEWEAQSIHPFGDRSWVHIDTGPDRIEFGARDDTGNVFEKYWIVDPNQQFALMALANAALPDGDPRKITHDDVLLLLGDRHGGFSADRPELWDAVQRLAMKLEAILPPDVTTYTPA